MNQNDDVTFFVASYGAVWQSLDGAIPYEPLKRILDKAQQNAIRTCDSEGLTALLDSIAISVPIAHARTTIPTGGRRESLVKVRNGQKNFRRILLQRDGLACAITVPCPEVAIEAAHLRAFAVHESHDPTEGILLLSDIHQLFDRGLIAIDPETMKVVVCPSLEPYELLPKP